MKVSLTQEYLDTMNEIVSHATPVGAYCVGIVSSLAWHDDTEPTPGMLQEAAKCQRISEAIKLYELWRALRGAREVPHES